MACGLLELHCFWLVRTKVIRPALVSFEIDIIYRFWHYRYYSLAHAVHEKIVKQPSMLAVGVLRDYQMVIIGFSLEKISEP